ncbi:MAG: hypothetical protein ACK4VI_09735 [Alphaproteobacteria bacterium]
MIKFLFAITLFAFSNFSAQAYELGEKLEDGMIFIYSEPVEIYGNLWIGKSLHQSKVYISGQGKTVNFEGILDLNCDSLSNSSWTAASNFYKPVFEEDDFSKIVPFQVMTGVFREFC